MQLAAARDRQDEFARHFPTSRDLSLRAQANLAGGVAHDSWQLDPHPVFMERASGPFKWDVDGGRFVDYWMGHGSLLLGHGFPPVVAAVRAQATQALHLGASHPLQVEWAERVCELVPSAERVRFTASGTEGTLLALRIARAFTGRPVVVRFDGHFHGWHDEVLAHFYPPTSAGLTAEAGANVAVASPFDVEDAIALLEGDDVAAVILEPGGGGSGALPWDTAMLATLREATRTAGALLVFDEVVSGFRYHPGGVQGLCGVLPDLTVLAKIMAGGLPGGAVTGSAEVMTVFGTGTTVGDRRAAVPHLGTFNANPLSASAGVAMLDHVGDGAAQSVAAAAASDLARQVNAAAGGVGVDVRLYAESSTFHIMIGAVGRGFPIAPSAAVVTLAAARPELYATLRRALLLEGVDSHPVHGWVSAAHDEATIRVTAESFARAFERVSGMPGFAVDGPDPTMSTPP